MKAIVRKSGRLKGNAQGARADYPGDAAGTADIAGMNDFAGVLNNRVYRLTEGLTEGY